MSDREMAHGWALKWFGEGFGAADLAAADIDDLIAVIATAREEGRREPRPITEAMVEAAAIAIMNCENATENVQRHLLDLARAAFEAAEKAR